MPGPANREGTATTRGEYLRFLDWVLGPRPALGLAAFLLLLYPTATCSTPSCVFPEVFITVLLSYYHAG